MHVSLDGFIARPNGELDWATRDDETMGKYLIGDLLSTVDTMLLGRVLYQGFASYWPAAATNPSTPKDLIDLAHWIVNSPKIVFSKTLEKAEWKNSRLVKVKDHHDPAGEVAKLKQQPGGDMVVFGGARLAQTFTELGLIDEYRLKLEPVVLGSGKPLFKNIKDRINLRLLKAKTFDSGVVGLYYEPDKKAKEAS